MNAREFIDLVESAEYNYLVKISGVEDRFWEQAFGRQVDSLKKVKEFLASAESTHVGAKGKATLAVVRGWIKDNKPSQYYAKWKKDSGEYKDDSVEIHYKK